jgi:hypothetical protein
LGSDIIGVDPILGPLALNGGNTLTHAIPTNSPAIDTGAIYPFFLTFWNGMSEIF